MVMPVRSQLQTIDEKVLEDAYLVAKTSDVIEMKASPEDTPESPTIIKEVLVPSCT
jgi:hypothetical protein